MGIHYQRIEGITTGTTRYARNLYGVCRVGPTERIHHTQIQEVLDRCMDTTLILKSLAENRRFWYNGSIN